MSKQFEAVTIPKWGIEMTHGRVVSWCFAEGQQVAAGTALVEIETDKIVNSFEARVAGTLARILVDEGEELPVGALIGVLALGPFAAADLEAFIAGYAHETEQGNEAAAAAIPNEGKAEDDAPIKISPALLRKLNKAGLAPEDIAGSGPGGRILKEDVDRALTAGVTEYTKDSREGANVPTDRTLLSPVQNRVAQKLTEAQNTVPLYHIQRRFEVDAAIAALRNDHPELSSAVTVLLLHAVGYALTQHAEINLQYDGEHVNPIGSSEVALAVARDDGAVAAPVLRDVLNQSPGELGQTLVDTIGRARRGELTAEDQHPAAIALSNLGMYDVTRFTAMVTPPQIMVLAVGAVQVQPLWRAEQQVFEARQCLDVTLGCDHRVVNGAQGAEFLRSMASFIAKAEFPAG